jgi:hypothetical protein
MPRKYITCPVCKGKGRIPLDEFDDAEIEKQLKKAIETMRKNRGLFTYPLPQNRIESV